MRIVSSHVEDPSLVISVEIDWANDTNAEPPFVHGVLFTKIGEANGWPVYRVTAPMHLLVHWVAEHYVGLDKLVAQGVADVFENVRFAKLTDAFTRLVVTQVAGDDTDNE